MARALRARALLADRRPLRHGRAERNAVRRWRLRAASRRNCSRSSTSTPSCACPNGVFAPYTSIPTNLLFFDRSGPTKEVWYYEHPLPEGRKNYTKTQPIQFEEFAPCIAWWKNRKENDQAWKVRAEDVLKYDADGKLLSCNLDLKNPRGKEDITHLPPDQLAAGILEKEQRIAEIMTNIRNLLAKRET